jgi:hypothetical protein
MINPIQYNLPFERFLNPGYSIIPNIDMDIESELWDDLFSNIKSDLSDLEERYQWALQNEEKCKQININSTEFIKLHSYDYVLKTIKI